MGILARPAAVIESLALPRGFSVCELGNQLYRANGRVRPAQDWYAALGCGEYVSIDANGRATVMADLNHPLPPAVPLGRFDLVTDFGTGEHIFNQAQVWATLHDLARVGGLIAFDRPHTGWAEHCFYNVHKTLIADLAAANGYRVVHLEVHPYPGHGDLLFGIMEKTRPEPFRCPNQGKYRALLQQARPQRVKRWHVLAELVRKNGWRKGAEIGVLDGATTFYLLETCPGLELIAVDSWAKDDAVYGDLTAVGATFRRRAAAYGDRLGILYGHSVDMAQEVADASLDFVFIDADHTASAVLADIKAWRPKVRPGGAVLGHDIDYASVAEAVRQVCGRWEVLPDDVWMVKV